MRRAALIALLLAAPLLLAAVWPQQSTSGCGTVLATSVNPDESGTTYLSLTDGTQSATEADVDDWIAPADGLMHSLASLFDVAPGVGTGWIVRPYVDGAAVNMGCILQDLATSDCENWLSLYRQFPVTAGSTVSISLQGVGPPDAAARMWVSFCFQAI